MCISKSVWKFELVNLQIIGGSLCSAEIMMMMCKSYLGGALERIPVDGDGVVGHLLDAAGQAHAVLRVCNKRALSLILSSSNCAVMAAEISIKISTHNTSSVTEIYLRGVNNHVIVSIYKRLQCFHFCPYRALAISAHSGYCGTEHALTRLTSLHDLYPFYKYQ